jgi:asparagine synthase (glutamine-hydrolysing)
MDMTFGAINLKNRANSLGMSTYFRSVFTTLSLSRPNLFLKGGFGIATACESLDDRYRSAGIFWDADSEILVVIHGDLVNRHEMEKELRAGQAPGASGPWSAPELVWRLYMSYGLDFVSRLDGVANIAIWHEREQSLVLIPDPFGLRPFYYFNDGSTFLFASSIKAVLQHPTVSRAVHPDGLHELLALGFILPPHTLFTGLKIVSAGDYLEFVDAPVVRPLPAKIAHHFPERDEDRMAEEYLELLKDAVSTRVRGANKVAVLLSGGVDSSAIVSLLRTVGTREIVTYSMHLDPGDRQELDAARDVSRWFGTKHVELTKLGPTTLNDLPEIIWQLEVPRVEVVAEHALCGLVDSVGGPVLTGDGNDIQWGLLSPTFLVTSGKNLVELYQLLRQRMTDERISAILPGSSDANVRLAARIAMLSRDTGNVFRDLISLDRRLFGAHFVNRMQGKLRIENRPMAFRFPYRDRRIIEFVASLPDQVKVGRSDSGRVIWKYLFKRSMEKQGMLPERIIHRKKTWMYHPTAAWFRQGFGVQLERLVLETGQEALRYFDAKCIRQLWREHREGKSDHTHVLETMLIFLLWHRIFIESKGCGRPGVSLVEMF